MSALVAAAVAVEAGWRAVRSAPPGAATANVELVLTIALVLTAGGGLGLLAGGARPRELLHFVYAVIAIGAIPVAGSLGSRLDPRGRAIITLVGGLVSLAVILRLSGTG